MAAHRNGKLEKMNIIFSQALREMSISKDFFSHMIMYYWPKIVGKHTAANVKPVKIEFKKLFLYTSHPVWATQLSYMEEDIVKKINSFMGEFLVEKIFFTNIPPEKASDENTAPEPNIGREIKKVNISDAELDRIKQDLSLVENDDLKQTLYKVRLNDEKYKKYRRQNNWQPCRKCENLCPPGETLCKECIRKENMARLAAIRNFLMDMPWARYCDVVKDIPCTAREVNEERIILMQKLAAKISARNPACFEMSLLTMLYKSVPPDKITDELVESTKKQFRYDFMDGFKYARKDRMKKYNKYDK